jgi:hypothetical protein
LLLRRGGGYIDRGEAKGDDKVILAIDGGDKENLTVVLHKEIFFN